MHTCMYVCVGHTEYTCIHTNIYTQIGKTFPVQFRTAVPPIVTSAGFTCILMCTMGIMQGVGWVGGLKQYRSLGGSLILAQVCVNSACMCVW